MSRTTTPRRPSPTVETFVNAIEAAGSIEPKKVRDAIAKINFESLYGHDRVRPDRADQPAADVIQIQNGKVAPIYGAKGFVNKLEYPMPAWNKR